MRLIDADALMKQLVRAHLTYENGEEGLGYTTVCFGSVIRNAPTIDAEPVVHGYWVAKKVMARTPFAINHYCSKCKFETDFCTNYCSNCGAKMDEVSEC